MISSLVIAFAVLILGTASRNRHIRNRLIVSALVFAAYAGLDAAIRYRLLTPGMQEQVVVGLPLFLVFAATNALVAVAINPWRVNRVPDRFPTIVQDAIVIAIFALGATVVLQEKIFA